MSNARRGKDQAFVWGDPKQNLYGNSDPDFVVKGKDGSVTIFEAKHYRRSGEDILPQERLIRFS